MKGIITITAVLFLMPFCASASAAESATVTLVTGRSTVATASGQVRGLTKAAGIFAGDTVITGPSSYVNLKFTDGGRVLLRPNSRFQVAEYAYTPPSDTDVDGDGHIATRQEGNAVFRLLKGGFRAVTGLIGRENRENFKVRTPVATIGIRGTDFEARLCSGDCFDVFPIPEDGLYAGVIEGGISLTNDAGTFTRDPDQYGFIPDVGATARALPQRPKALAADPMPDPEACGD